MGAQVFLSRFRVSARATLLANFLAGFLALTLPALAANSKETILHQFSTAGDGQEPLATVIVDKAGNLYGTTYAGGSGTNCGTLLVGCGTVFELSPASQTGGSWTETILYNFQGGADGAEPNGLVFDATGNLYGTTQLGGGGNCLSDNDVMTGCGTVFELSPPTLAGGPWTEKLLYSFTGGSDGAFPDAGMSFDKAGNLYSTANSGGVVNCANSGNGTATGCGTVFELSPPATSGGAWTESTLYAFQGGNDGGFPFSAGVVISPTGKIYGANAYAGGTSEYCQSLGCGTVYELAPPKTHGSEWTETVLHAFQEVISTDPNVVTGGVTLRDGVLYGTTRYGGQNKFGAAFELTPSQNGTWTMNVIYSFGNGAGDALDPEAGVVSDSKGNLYGTTMYGGKGTCNAGCGTVFELVPPLTSGGTWTESIVYSFRGGNAGVGPSANVTLNKGLLYGTTPSGGNGCPLHEQGGCGTVFSIIP